ncbi:MAG: membrane protein of unknown function [Promethearchaeota archaeon]|nr:MAG: membrane protein of unknown function [Candidatus Lokiarchaeota archaeon]
MIGAYSFTTNFLSLSQNVILPFLIFGILTNTMLNVVFPTWWMVYHENQSLKELGITGDCILPAILFSMDFSIFPAFPLIPQLNQVENGIAHLVYNGIILWEPFFVYCWLQLCYEKAFGIIPGILLTGLSFMVYHIGSYSFESFLILLFWGLVFALIFHFINNIFVLWPIKWSVSSSLGTLMGGTVFSWNIFRKKSLKVKASF